jgi:hypothetical protein
MENELPNRASAVVPEEKLTKYLLNEAHPEGGPKAKFLKRFGYNLSNRDELERALLKLANLGVVSQVKATVFCTKYVVKGRLETPDGRHPSVETVWKIDNGEEIPKLVTAYPD